jgi:hydrogenase maturation protease
VTGSVVIGVGNEYRRDDGIALTLIAELAGHVLPGTRLVASDGEPAGLLAEWSGADLAVVVDAVSGEPAEPGRIHRTSLGELRRSGGVASSHGLGIPEAVALGRALGRLPQRLVVYAVEAADLNLGVGLTPDVAAALPELLTAVCAELTTVHTRQ